jgi:AcrR family transcriptional regulator
MSRKEQAEASRAALVEAARECFTDQGYEDTTVAGILERAGMARGALYHYFPGGKQEIFTAVFEMINGSYHQRRDAAGALPSPLGRLRAGIRVFLEMCVDDDFARITLRDAPGLVPGQGWRGSSYVLMRTQLVEAMTAGEVAPLDPDAMAMALYGAVRSGGEYVIESTDRPAAVDRAAQAIDQLLDGLRAPA